MLLGYFTYLAIFGSILPGKVVPGATLSDGTRLHYRCNGQKYDFCTPIKISFSFSLSFCVVPGLLLLFLLVILLGIGGWMDLLSPTVRTCSIPTFYSMLIFKCLMLVVVVFFC